MSHKILELQDVHLAYKSRVGLFGKNNWILKGLTFDLNQGEVLGVLGRNGAGKSTLLKLLANIITPTKGRIIRHSNTRAQLLSLNLGFVGDLNASDNIILSLATQGISIKEAKSKVESIIDYAEINHISRNPIRTYSSGERARLGFSIAICASPDILLLDEVLSVGDENFKKKSSRAISDLISSNQTVVLVSHSPNTIKKFCERTAWIKDGKTEEFDLTENVLEKYKKSQQQ